MFVSSIKPIDFDKVWCAKADISVKKRLKLAENCSDTIIVNVRYLSFDLLYAEISILNLI